MKKITLSVLLSLLLCLLAGAWKNAAEVETMTDKIIRIHILANSDSPEDQELKLKVRDAVLSAAGDIFDGCEDKISAEEKIRENIGYLESVAEEELRKSGSGLKASCRLSREEFDRRVYDDITLPAGEYDSLVIGIGEAKGKNWWCICYPALCIGTSVSVEECGVFTEGEIKIVKFPEKVRYKLWCFEAVKKLKKIFA